MRVVERLGRGLSSTKRLLAHPVPSTVTRELLPLALPVLMFPWLLLAVRNYADASMSRDANMFSYAAFCFRRGEHMYRDFATPDGPLIYIIQAIFQTVWGTSSRDLRIADLDVAAAFGAIVGMLVVPRARDRLHGVLRRATWATVGGCAWLAQMLSFDNPSTFQREDYYAGIGCVAIALAYGSEELGKRAARVMIVAAGLLGALELFGKHSGVIYLSLVLLTVWLSRSASLPRRERLLAATAGIVAGVGAMTLLIALDGSLRGFWSYYFQYNFVVYKHLWVKEPAELLLMADRRDYSLVAVLSLLGGAAAIRARVVSPAIAGFAVGPVLHLAAAIAQMRGWRYHYVPVQASAHAAFVALMAVAWCAPRTETGPHPVREIAAIAAFVFFGWRIHETAVNATFLDKAQKLNASADDSDGDLHRAGEYLATHTRSTDRVFYYGGNPAPLYEAKRLPATPYIVAWLVDFRNTLQKQGDHGSLTVTPEQRAKILAIQADVRADDCARVLDSKPAALVFMDMASIGLDGDPRKAVESWCPSFHDMVAGEYHEGVTAGRHHIFLRNDRQ